MWKQKDEGREGAMLRRVCLQWSAKEVEGGVEWSSVACILGMRERCPWTGKEKANGEANETGRKRSGFVRGSVEWLEVYLVGSTCTWNVEGNSKAWGQGYWGRGRRRSLGPRWGQLQDFDFDFLLVQSVSGKSPGGCDEGRQPLGG